MTEPTFLPSSEPLETFSDYLLFSNYYHHGMKYEPIFRILIVLMYAAFFIQDIFSRNDGLGETFPLATSFIIIYSGLSIIDNNKKIKLEENGKQCPFSSRLKLEKTIRRHGLLPNENDIFSILLIMAQLFAVIGSYFFLIAHNTYLAAIILTLFTLTDIFRSCLIILKIKKSISLSPYYAIASRSVMTFPMIVLLGTLFYISLSDTRSTYDLTLLVFFAYFISLGLVAILNSMEKTNAAIQRYAKLEKTFEPALEETDPTFGSIIAGLPKLLYQISANQRIIQWSGLALGVVLYIAIIIFLNIDPDPFASPLEFLAWLTPIAISSIAVLFTVERSERSQFLMSSTLSKLEGAIEQFKRLNQQYLSLLDGE